MKNSESDPDDPSDGAFRAEVSLSNEQIRGIVDAFSLFWIAIYVALPMLAGLAGLGYQEWMHDSVWAWAYLAQLTYRWYKWFNKPYPRTVMPTNELEDKIDKARLVGYLWGYIFGVMLAGHEDYPVLAVWTMLDVFYEVIMFVFPAFRHTERKLLFDLSRLVRRRRETTD